MGKMLAIEYELSFYSSSLNKMITIIVESPNELTLNAILCIITFRDKDYEHRILFNGQELQNENEIFLLNDELFKIWFLTFPKELIVTPNNRNILIIEDDIHYLTHLGKRYSIENFPDYYMYCEQNNIVPDNILQMSKDWITLLISELHKDKVSIHCEDVQYKISIRTIPPRIIITQYEKQNVINRLEKLYSFLEHLKISIKSMVTKVELTYDK